jgi:hypothetical protein
MTRTITGHAAEHDLLTASGHVERAEAPKCEHLHTSRRDGTRAIETDFEGPLRPQGVEYVVIAGLTGAMCVGSVVRCVVERGPSGRPGHGRPQRVIGGGEVYEAMGAWYPFISVPVDR